MIKGDAGARIRAPEVRKLPCSDQLMEIKRLREKGHRITIISEAQFRRLATSERPAKSPRR